MKIRKVYKQDLYKVVDDNNNIIAIYNSKDEAKKHIRVGGKIISKYLKSVLKNSYNKKPKEEKIDNNLIMDKDLSGRRVQTYIDNNTGEVYFTIRGTQGMRDILTDIKLFFTPTSKLKNLKRFKYADEMLKKVEQKYGKENINVIGHSLGSKIAEIIGDENHKNIITYNKPVLPFEKIIDKKNQIDIKTSRDPISLLDKPDENDIVLQSKSLNPVYEHSLQALEDYLPDDVVIGSGYKQINKKAKKGKKKINL